MSTTFPTSLQGFTNPISTDSLNTPGVLHTEQHANINDTVEALQAKIGINGSTDPNSIDYKIANATGDMNKSTYDPTNKEADAFDMDNMEEGTTNKILTAAERTKITNSFDNLNGGCIVAHTFTDNGNGTINVPSCACNIWNNATFQGIPQRYTLAALTNQVLTDGVTNYIVGDYNGGTPILKVITDVTLITESNVVPVLTIYRNGNYLHSQNWDALGVGLANKVHQSIVKTQRYRRESGLTIAETGTRNIVITEGKIWTGAVPIILYTIDTSGDEFIFLYKHVAGVWTLDATSKQYNNTQYDNGTDLATLTAGRYAVNWVYRGVENQKHCYVVLGVGDYTLVQAQEAIVPNIPTAISSHAVLVGKIIIQKSAGAATSIQSAFTTTFSTSGVTSHSDLTNLQGGAASEYYHLTSAELARLNDITPTNDTDIATKKYVDDNIGGGGGNGPIISGIIAGELMVGTLGEFPISKTITAATFRISLKTLPTGADFICKLYKNGTEDASVTIATGASATNGLYQGTDTSFVSGSYVAGDVLKVSITQIGSTLSGTGLTFSLTE